MGPGQREAFVRYGTLIVGLLLALTLSSCISRYDIRNFEPKNTEEAQVLSALLKIPTGINSKTIEIVMQPYAEDVYIGNFHKYLGIAAAGAPRTISKADLRSAYTQLFKSVKGLRLDLVNFSLTATPDRATAQARMELQLNLEATKLDPKQETLRNDVLWRLRRTPSGWRIEEEIYE
jgi:ketosteroid isomerase-like protein